MIAFAETGGARAFALTDFEPLCADYNVECGKLEEMMAAMEADLEAVKHRHLRALKRQAAVVAAREGELHGAVESNPRLFGKPRTAVLQGTKIGFMTSPGSVTFDDEARVVQLIGAHFKERFDELVKTERTPRKEALRTLTAAELTKLGCRIEGAGEFVVLKRVAGDVEKLINRLIDKLVTGIVAAK